MDSRLKANSYCNKPGHVKRKCFKTDQKTKPASGKPVRPSSSRAKELGVPSRPTSDKKAKVCPVSIFKSKTHTLLDTGADISLVSSEFLNSLRKSGIKILSHPCKLSVRGVTDQSLKIKGKINLPVRIKSKELAHAIADILGHPALLGSDFMSNLGATLDFSNRTMIIGHEVVLLKDKPTKSGDGDPA